MARKARTLIHRGALGVALAAFAPASPAAAGDPASPAAGQPRLINPERPPHIVSRGQRQQIPKACVALVASRKSATACDFVSGLPMYENDVRIPAERAAECPSPVEFEYDDPRDGKAVADLATPRKGVVYTCGGPIREVRVR